MMRVKEILDFALVQTGSARKGEIPNDLHDHALDALNLAYEQVWNLFPWDASKLYAIQATTTDGEITLPSYVDNIRAARVSDKPLSAVGVIRVNNFNPQAFETSGESCEYIYHPSEPVLTQPTSAINVRVVSTSTADTSAVGSIRIVGTAGGVETTEDIALNGTGNSDGSVNFTHIRKISKPITTGRVSIKDTSDNELGTVAPWETQPEYPRVRLVPPPTSSTTVTFQCLRRFERLVSDNDAVTPAIMGKPITHLVMAYMFRRFGEDQRAAIEEQQAQDCMRTVEKNENEHNDKDFSTMPAYGMFGDLGDYSGSISGWPYYKTR